MHVNDNQANYKIRLESGRILGPIDLARIQQLVLKNQVVGKESVRSQEGDWEDINKIPELAELLLRHASGNLKNEDEPNEIEIESADGYAATKVLTLEHAVSDDFEAEEKTRVATRAQIDFAGEDDEKTRVGSSSEFNTFGKEALEGLPLEFPAGTPLQRSDSTFSKSQSKATTGIPSVSYEQTRVLDRSVIEAGGVVGGALPVTAEPETPKKKLFGMTLPTFHQGKRPPWMNLVVLIVFAGVAYEMLFDEEPKSKIPAKPVPIVAKLPSFQQGKSDPKLSDKVYLEGMKVYLGDHVIAYREAAKKFLEAASLNNENVKALSMLATTYLNAVDASNKDADYFNTISKLIEMSRAKSVDLPETVIADVEFYVTTNRAEAAQNRIVEYTKTHPSYGIEMFFYLSYAFAARGDYQSASRFISRIPDNQIYTARIFYLRAQISEKQGDIESAMQDYQRAIKFNPKHAKSRLKISELFVQKGHLKEAGPHLEYLIENTQLMTPRELAQAYYFHALFNMLLKKMDFALNDLERAVKLDKDNHEYLLEYYTLKARFGQGVKTAEVEAKTFYFLGEGEKQAKEGKYHEALVQFLEARRVNPNSPLPLIKTGDMFYLMNDLGNARESYKAAALKAPKNSELLSKYIKTLIRSFEWDEAKKTIEQLRALPGTESYVDKAAGDVFARQNRHAEAQVLYKKAMDRSLIDPEVYIAYANSLMGSQNYKESPLFFSLALRFDPLNVDAIIGTAKAVAALEGPDRGISRLQDELQKPGGSKAEFLAALAELQIQKGDWTSAQQFVTQAFSLNPDYSYPWKLQAQIYLQKENSEKGALDKALEAYKSYSDRNPSDPSGYLERYKIFYKKTQFENATNELNKIFELFPKYPNLHYYKGLLYAGMSNHKVAIEEFMLEDKNNPNNPTTILAFGKELIEGGYIQDALKLFNQAMQLVPTQAEPRHQAGYANYLLKNYQGAIALYQGAIKMDKGNPLIYKRLGLAYKDVGDSIRATENFQKYLQMEPDAPDKAEFEKYR